ncbi:MAG: DUF5320 domain-containing protein [Candidatus Shapirobacteria bacterium]|nr:DUF5320 domain-containing protein [Candidatus Shapirobacteria bacterium]
MPNRDKTGPLGQGPATGRGFGPCGKGLGRGLGRGLCRFQSLSDYRKALEEELEDVKKQEEDLK